MTSVDGAIANALAAQAGSIKSQVATAVAAKSLDAVKQQGEAVAQLIEQVAQISKAIGKGANFDAHA